MTDQPDRDPGGPAAVRTLADLVAELSRLRRRAARPGQRQLSVRDLAARTGIASSTLDPYLRGARLCPMDTYEKILRALGVPNAHLRPWLNAWERVAEGPVPAVAETSRGNVTGRPTPLRYTEEFRYAVVGGQAPDGASVNVVTGDLRRIRCAEVWVNPENTHMRMARFEDFSTSAIIRYEGAQRDETGLVVADTIADELHRRVAGRTPVAPGTAITTGSGNLAQTNGVRYVIHVAAVHGEPGEGYQQVADVAGCVTNALAEAERIAAVDEPVRSILFPLLGAGTGGGDLEHTATALLGAALDHFAAPKPGTVRAIYFLAYTDRELDLCRAIFDDHRRLRLVD
jgi:O-acetyl-ADP-ribose deacetylase (regulator of RNase III)/transcriptional regulator with XRE-family HTH domain